LSLELLLLEVIGVMQELLVLKISKIPMIPPCGRSFHGILLRQTMAGGECILNWLRQRIEGLAPGTQIQVMEMVMVTHNTRTWIEVVAAGAC